MSCLKISRKQWNRLKNSIKKPEKVEKTTTHFTKSSSIPQEWFEYYKDLQKVKAKDEKRKKQYYILPKHRKKERDEYVKEKRKEICNPVLPLHPFLQESVFLSEILFEREKQLELNKIIHDEKRKENEFFKQEIDKAVKLEKEKEELQKKEIAERKKEFKLITEKQINENHYCKEKIKNKVLEEEKQKWLVIEANNDEERINQLKNALDKKKQLREDIVKFLDKKKQIEEERNEQRRVETVLNEIYRDAKILQDEQIRKGKVRIQEEIQNRRQILEEKMKKLNPTSEEQDDKTIVDDNIQRLRILQADKIEKMKREKNLKEENLKMFKEKKALDKKNELEIKQFLTLRRNELHQRPTFANNSKRMQNNLNTETLSKMSDLKKEHLLDQYDAEKWLKQDENFFLKAKETENYLKGINRPVKPIHQAVEKYKKENNIL